MCLAVRSLKVTSILIPGFFEKCPLGTDHGRLNGSKVE